MDAVLIGIRIIHFASTVMAGGILWFCCLIAGPAGAMSLAHGRFRRALARLLWANLGLVLLSGAAWLLVLSADIAGETAAEALSEGVPWIVLAETRFGHAWIARLVIAGLIAAGIARLDLAALWTSKWLSAGAILLGAGFLGLLASAGHAGATGGLLGAVHWIADALHLVAVGAWLGGLAPLALLLAAAGRDGDEEAAPIAVRATHRFSTLGVAAVAAILLSGLVNSFVLVGSVSALVESDYGRVLLIKIAVFLAMVTLAADNLLRLRHRVLQPSFMQRLKLNSLAEAWLGFVVIVIVAVLGLMMPGAHLHHLH